MAIIINIDSMMEKRGFTDKTLAERIDLSEENLSFLKRGRAKAIKLSTLEKLCKELKCQPADLLEYLETPDEV